MELSLESTQNIIDTYVIPYGLNIIFAIVIFIIGKMVVKLLTKVSAKLLNKAKVDDILVDFLTGIISSILMLFVIIASLGQLGVDTTSLVALIGAAGLAIGLSLQGSLQNFASGVMLIVFRPFKDGDFVEVAGVAGVVEKITIFTTQMRTGDNKQVIIPNGKIYGDVITNYSAKPTRRVDMVFGIGYDDDIKKAKEIMQQVIEKDERILADPAPTIAVSELADSSVNFVVRPWVNSADYWGVYFDYHENIKLAFDEANISIPYPQMDVHLDKLKTDED
ncbi:mechanosensitive ion channel family protein [Aliikangiella coralliicola]|uniref:Small-conductance mechanosensitive channel n=1 Tax=Aliikangiella coralliicola TaxID=2592383 RepID=A0A545UB49_9GAMM|nr:mechanosensitive ion channel domain-containing protein [Aliikangiella coralliicola]TQV86685.1 mechanosensitive ion channel [Aliikangiella coralliicola]